MKALTWLAGRFVAGETLEEALPVVRRLNDEGLKVTLDHLGEECRSVVQAKTDVKEYVEMLRAIARHQLDCNVSLKLTQLGLNLDPKLAEANLVCVVEEAKKHGNFVRIDMEGSAYTQMTLDLFNRLFSSYPNMGVVIQAGLRRSPNDIDELARRGARVRLCKGAYKEPSQVAFPAKEDVNRQYDLLAEKLVHGRAPSPAFATHDDERILRAQALAQKSGLGKERYEFQMLYGLRPRRWRELSRDGHIVRVYVPYGKSWLPYFYRRLRERKENWLFVLKSLVSG